MAKSSEGELALIGNGKFYGGQMEIFPGADLRDGLLDVCVFPRVKAVSALGNALRAALLNGCPQRRDAVARGEFTSPPRRARGLNWTANASAAAGEIRRGARKIASDRAVDVSGSRCKLANQFLFVYSAWFAVNFSMNR